METKTCPVCAQSFETNNDRKLYCSTSCKRKNNVPSTLRAQVVACETCLICGEHFDRVHLDAHHVVPGGFGGKTTLSNLVPLCSNKLGQGSCHTAIHQYYSAMLVFTGEANFAKWIEEARAKARTRKARSAQTGEATYPAKTPVRKLARSK